MAKVKVQNPNEISTEVLADAIVAIAEGVRKLRAGRLQDRTLCMLIADAAPVVGKGFPKHRVSQRDVKAVLDGIADLERIHLKRKAS